MAVKNNTAPKVIRKPVPRPSSTEQINITSPIRTYDPNELIRRKKK